MMHLRFWKYSIRLTSRYSFLEVGRASAYQGHVKWLKNAAFTAVCPCTLDKIHAWRGVCASCSPHLQYSHPDMKFSRLMKGCLKVSTISMKKCQEYLNTYLWEFVSLSPFHMQLINRKNNARSCLRVRKQSLHQLIQGIPVQLLSSAFSDCRVQVSHYASERTVVLDIKSMWSWRNDQKLKKNREEKEGRIAKHMQILLSKYLEWNVFKTAKVRTDKMSAGISLFYYRNKDFWSHHQCCPILEFASVAQ